MIISCSASASTHMHFVNAGTQGQTKPWRLKAIACLLTLLFALSACGSQSPPSSDPVGGGAIPANAAAALLGADSPGGAGSVPANATASLAGSPPGGASAQGGAYDFSDIQQASDKADPKNDRISTAALSGSWIRMTGNRTTVWAFEGDRFVGYLVAQAGNYYYDSYGYSYYRSTSAYKHVLQGKYEVTGGVIRFSDCQISTTMVFDTEPWHNSSLNDAMFKMMFTRLDEPSRADDFTAEFEFIDNQRLRIRLARGALEEYDMDFRREDGPVTVEIPTHRIPPAIWPTHFLSPEMPDYGDAGRIRTVSQGTAEDVAPEYQYISIDIDRTSQNAILNYAWELRRLGWSGPSDEQILAEKRKAEDSILSLVTTDYSFDFYKGVYRLNLRVTAEDAVSLLSNRYVEGSWPSALFGDEFRPHEGAVYIGDTSDSLYYYEDDESYSMSIEVDFYPGTVDSYFDNLLAKGFLNFDNIYNNLEFVKFMRIGDRMYKVKIAPGYSVNGSIASVRYWLTYYPDMAWPDDFPSEVVPPPGYDLFWEYYHLASNAMNGSQGSFNFSMIGLTQNDLDAYFNSLAEKGWGTSWMGNGLSKPFAWNGGEWYFQIEFYSSLENLVSLRLTWWQI